MARIAFGLAGAVVGGFFGGPAGANAGYLIGSTVGGFLFPDPPVVTEGPRLGDLSLTASTYGSAIPLGYGTLRMGGNLIWASPIREVRSENDVSQGKGGAPSQVQVTYSYFADIAYAFAEGPADNVLRIWFDSKVVHDKRGQNVMNTDGLNFVFYPGDEEQLPDSTIEAIEGVGMVPAHRGTVYIVFKNLNLSEYGNRIPQCTAEIAFNSASANSARLLTTNPIYRTTYSTSDMAVDVKRRRAYFLGGTADTLFVANYDTFFEIRETLQADVTTSAPETLSFLHCVDTDGFLYAGGGSANAIPILKIDPNTLTEVARFGFTSPTQGPPVTLETGGEAIIIEALNPIPDPSSGTPGRRKFLLHVGVFDQLAVLDADNMTFLEDEYGTFFTTLTGMCPVPAELSPLGYGTGYFANQSAGNANITLHTIKLSINASYESVGGFTHGYERTSETIPNTVWGADGAAKVVTGPVYDPADGGVIFIQNSATIGCYVFKWLPGVGLSWVTHISTAGMVAPNNDKATAIASKITNGVFGFTNEAHLAVLLDTTDGSVIVGPVNVETLPSPSANNDGQSFYDGETQSILYMQGSGNGRVLGQFFLGRVSGLGESLSGIVTDLSTRVGLTAGDLTVSELTDTVRGYGVTRQMPARAAVEPLATAFLFDGIESDDKVEFKKRGRDPERTVTRDDMLIVSEETHDVVQETRTQEVEIPQRISVSYMDPDTDYQQGTQSVKRIKSPSPTMRSDNEQTIQVPIVMTASEAEQLAEKLLFTAWNERTTYSFRLPWEHLDLDPADVINVQLAQGAVITNLRTRIVQAVANLDLTISIEALSEDKLTVVSDAAADGGLGVPSQTVAQAAFTQLWLFDIPLLRDIDDGGSVAARIYYAMDGLRDGWPGGVLYRSLDALTYTNTGFKSTTPVTHGSILGTLPDTATPFQTDETTEITVFLEEGTLSSVTQAEFLNNANVCLIGNPTTGIYEIICFRDVVDEGGGRYVLSGLMRGRRGTEVFVGSHVPGEKFFFLENPEISGRLEEISALNQSLFFKGVGYGTQIESADTVATSFVGRSQFPYAPCLLDAVVDSGDNIDLSWVRRDRIGGELKDGLGEIPMSEDTEAYEIDIKDGPGGNVLRTLTSSTQSKQYDSLFIQQDFGYPATFLAPYDSNANDISTLAATGTLGANAALQSTQKVFGAQAVELSPSSGTDATAFVSYPDNNAYDLTTQAFTIEAWVRLKSLPSGNKYTIMAKYLNTGDQRSWAFSILNSTTVEFLYYTDGGLLLPGTAVTGSFTFATNTWYHIACARDENNNFRMFVNGVQVGTTTTVSANIFSGTALLKIGGRTSSAPDPLNGFIDDPRLIVGSAIYKSAFTPPTQAHQTSAFPTSITYEVFQMSAQTGRGFGAELTKAI